MTEIDSSNALMAKGISKTFPGVQALDNVDLTLRHGKLTALLGENGAGKSTLMNIVAGVLRPSSGELTVGGKPVRFHHPRQAQEHGISMIFQELNLVTGMTVAENILLGREPLRRSGLIDFATMNRTAKRLLEQLELDILPTTTVGKLRVGQQQLVEIAKALAVDVRILIMDEPTSAITEREIDVLFERILDLKRKGVAIAYITHKLEELERIGDDVVIMRDGRVIDTVKLGTLSRDQMVQKMVGREITDKPRHKTSDPVQEVLRVHQMTLPHPDRSDDYLVHHVDLQLHRGEVLGIFGLMGAGRTELLECLFGLHPHQCSGEVIVDGVQVRINSPADAIANGLSLAPEDRKRDGLVLSMSVAENVSLACLRNLVRLGMIDRRAEMRQVKRDLSQFQVKSRSPYQCIRELSGGNQQKVILAKWLATKPKVLLLDEPTRGIDVQAKKEVYEWIGRLKSEGLAVLVVSSELPEILAISDRIMVLCEGRRIAEFSSDEANEEKIMQAALPRKAIVTC